MAIAVNATPGRRAFLILRLLFPALAIGYMLHVIPLRDVVASFAEIPAYALCAACALISLGTLLAIVRWRVVLAACGMSAKPRWVDLARAYMIGSFYNVYVPGGLGGDVLRAIATRDLVGAGGTPAALAVVFLERTLGLAALLVVLAVGFTIFPLPGVGSVMFWSGTGLCIAAGAVVLIVSGRRLARYLPSRFARVAASLPQITSLPHFALALGLSLLTQFAGIGIGHVLVAGLSPSVRWSESIVILPLANALQFFPLTIGGAGVREAAYVVLYALVGVPKPRALAASLAVGALAYAFNLLGGIWHAFQPLALEQPAAAHHKN
jgi:uncharacterized membrane protein YbhN (UPF0104 family)